VAVSVETKGLLDGLRSRLGARTYDEVIRRLAEAYGELERLQTALLVRRLLCNELGEARASMQAWVRLVASRVENPSLVPLAVSVATDYLIRDPQDPEVYVVSKERCGQGP
jgi:hypothetical protein